MFLKIIKKVGMRTPTREAKSRVRATCRRSYSRCCRSLQCALALSDWARAGRK